VYIENSGANLYKKKLYIIETKKSVADMRKAVKKMAALTLKLVRDEDIFSPEEDNYI
jgi:glycine reductase